MGAESLSPFRKRNYQPPKAVTPAEAPDAALETFASEMQPVGAGPIRAIRRVKWRTVFTVLLVIAAIAETVAPELMATGWFRHPIGGATLVLAQTPAGAELVVDGVSRGPGPHRLDLAKREHTVAVRRLKPVAAGETPGGRPATWLAVISESPGATVLVDGVQRGLTPLVLGDVAPGERRVDLNGAAGNASRTVTVRQDATMIVSVRLTKPATLGGWLSIRAAVPFEVHESGRLVGTSQAERLMILSRSYHRNVLVIDADLRRPDLHRLFGAPQEGVLTDALRAVSDGTAVPVREIGERLGFLSAGRSLRDSVAAFSSDAT